MTTIKTYTMTCDECQFSTKDQALMERHSCDVQMNGGRCEDYPCCGHEDGDCNGRLYGSDEAIKEYTYKHIGCDHEAGIYDCEDLDDEEPEVDDMADEFDEYESDSFYKD